MFSGSIIVEARVVMPVNALLEAAQWYALVDSPREIFKEGVFSWSAAVSTRDVHLLGGRVADLPPPMVQQMLLLHVNCQQGCSNILGEN